MKTKFFLNRLLIVAGISMSALLVSCNGGTPKQTIDTAVNNAVMEDSVKNDAENYIVKHHVPAVVVDAFNKENAKATNRQWFVYSGDPNDLTNVEIPDAYVVAYGKDNKKYKEKYSRQGEVMEIVRLGSTEILPDSVLQAIKSGQYKDWKISGDIYEKMDKDTRQPNGYVVVLQNGDKRVKLFFDPQGDITETRPLKPRSAV